MRVRPVELTGGSSKVNVPTVLARYDAVTADARCSPGRQTAVTCEGLVQIKLSVCERCQVRPKGMGKLRVTVRHPGGRMLLTGRHGAIWGNLDTVEHQLSGV